MPIRSLEDQVPLQARATIDRLKKAGWMLNQVYGDDVVNMIKVYEQVNREQAVQLFVDKDGKVGVPRTSATMLAAAELLDAGFPVGGFGPRVHLASSAKGTHNEVE